MALSADAPYNVVLKSQLSFAKLGTLVHLFKKYLIRRLQLTPADNTEIEALGLLLGVLVSRYRDTIEVFDANDLYQLLAVLIQHPDKLKNYLPYIVEINFNSSVSDLLFKKGRSIQVCYFGEFVYYCRTVDRHPNSVVALIVMESNSQDELLLIKEIGEECTAELGFSLFSVLRNYFLINYDTRYSELVLNLCAQIDEGMGFDNCYNHYAKTLKKVERFPELTEYLNKFLVFLRSNACLPYWHFSNNLLQSENLQNAFRDKAQFLNVFGRDRYLIKLLQFVLEMLLSLRCEFSLEDLTLSTFEKLPEFFRLRWGKCEYGSESITNHIFEEVTQTMDFLMYTNLIGGYDEKYYKLCNAIGNVIISYYKLSQSDINTIEKFALLPFFGIFVV